jgi:hypothetical protein
LEITLKVFTCNSRWRRRLLQTRLSHIIFNAATRCAVDHRAADCAAIDAAAAKRAKAAP